MNSEKKRFIGKSCAFTKHIDYNTEWKTKPFQQTEKAKLMKKAKPLTVGLDQI